ncbi:hypothetical protein [Porphyromonas cangingivalis]|uniref:hypothetical protein n=1 Tax=Porphyromonas cangingivalis TaxID=36874 RepID=UPI00242DFD01|nr:hypothetical protein [Porphyromonas cangingivalis]
MMEMKEQGLENQMSQADDLVTLVEVYTTYSLQAAYGVVGYLSTYDIEALVEGETIYSAVGSAYLGDRGVSVMVRSSDRQKAVDALIAGGQIPGSDTVDNKKWYSPLPFMKDAPLWVQLLVIILIVALILGALALYLFLNPNSNGLGA